MRKLILLSGPTCTGKTTVEKALNKLGIPSIISYTTREPRPGEINGKDYYFLTHKEVHDLELNGKIIQKVEFANNLYGSTCEALDNAFKNSDTAVIVVEPTGVSQFKRYFKSSEDIRLISIYLDADYSTIVERLIARYLTDTSDTVDPSYYWIRLVQQYEAYHDWPGYTNWTEVIPKVDHEIIGCEPDYVAKRILEIAMN